jgi:hypothetical protein
MDYGYEIRNQRSGTLKYDGRKKERGKEENKKMRK